MKLVFVATALAASLATVGGGCRATTPLPAPLSLDGSPAAPETPAMQETDGKAPYLKNCKQCHGVLGEPTKQAVRQNDKIPSFTNAAFFATRSDDSLVAVMKKGAGKDMKSFAEKMTAPEMAAVAKYIRTLPANKQTK